DAEQALSHVDFEGHDEPPLFPNNPGNDLPFGWEVVGLPDMVSEWKIEPAPNPDSPFPTVDVVAPSGTFSGPYTVSFNSFNPPCTSTETGTLTLTFNGNPLGDLGTATASGLQLLAPDCSAAGTTTASGGMFGACTSTR